MACHPTPPHWDAVTLIKERDGASARMAPLYNVTGGSQGGSAGGGDHSPSESGGGGFPRCQASYSFPHFARITMTTGNSGYPESHSHLEKQKTSFAFLHAAPLTVADFGWVGEGGLWRRHDCSKINTQSRRRCEETPPSPSVSSLFPGLGRISEESAEFFERVNAVLQKQQNMLQAAQAEVTSNHASTFPSVTCFKLRPRRHRFLGGGALSRRHLSLLYFGFVFAPSQCQRGAPAVPPPAEHVDQPFITDRISRTEVPLKSHNNSFANLIPAHRLACGGADMIKMEPSGFISGALLLRSVFPCSWTCCTRRLCTRWSTAWACPRRNT